MTRILNAFLLSLCLVFGGFTLATSVGCNGDDTAVVPEEGESEFETEDEYEDYSDAAEEQLEE